MPRSHEGSRWAEYQRMTLAEPRHRPIYLLYMFVGVAELIVSFLTVHNSQSKLAAMTGIGIGLVLFGGAEYLPRQQSRLAGVMRIAAAIIGLGCVVILCVLSVS